ncbi:hypothetical protein CIG2463D_1492 [Campylobacter iguaniorum]|uniref:hypothetical protein n=1 Tax=Campylobacter iguaniorum TaxID=1244531 RepID=UPI00073A8977|nr:hypothetical protein [Campylobacter iguaniorum]ALV25057.1 hypothetical protein CIG2463D_1492 [Campylobacter iguaniorum]
MEDKEIALELTKLISQDIIKAIIKRQDWNSKNPVQDIASKTADTYKVILKTLQETKD